MMKEILLYTGSGIIFLWGVAHILPTKSIVSGFGEISIDNRRIITLEWIVGGVSLCFIGALVFLVTLLGASGNPISQGVTWLSAAALLLMAVVSLFTGARTAIIPMKICPAIQTLSALLFILGNVL